MAEALKTRDYCVASRRDVAAGIAEFVLRPVDGGEIATFTPGAHITIRTPSGAMRRYSLVNDGSAPEEYVIAVKREPDSRGGSASMHDQAVKGTVLAATEPENDFELVDAPRYLLIAGGIGITPIYAMARHLAAEGKPFELVYCSRTANEAAYLEELHALGGKITIHHDEGSPDNFYDFWDHLEKPSPIHVYCCGPAPLMEEIKAISGHWPEGRVHFEDFKPVEVVRADDRPFDVTLAASGRTVTVPADKTILETLREAGEATVSSCESGTCGTCRCTLIEGDVDHRDMVLMDDEKDRYIMICISRAREGDLIIDL